MAKQIKDYNPIVKNIANLHMAIAVEANNLGFGNRDDLQLTINRKGEEETYPMEYRADKNSYVNVRLPIYLTEEEIMNGTVDVK